MQTIVSFSIHFIILASFIIIEDVFEVVELSLDSFVDDEFRYVV